MLIRLIVPGELARVEDMNASLEAVLMRHGIDQALRDDVRLIVEELASNVIKYGGDPKGIPRHELSVHIDIDDKRLQLEFRDTGAPFDPTAEPEPDLDGDILERDIGGLGLHLIRSLAESVEYRREEPYNLLDLSLRLNATENAS
ncbi:ATP-binding protein [Marilutibacter aestuarii]|uniref:ATP-binding protein n=1 Tax=Marilutibacter aestuarii TaxID=1706195 RepID=A0A508A9S2_9GAMM|nr:ATP-binding protein [Lysobacter aestuarii]TQD45281.1 ATP-binding protein [Lysobacter aestuarii]